MWMEGRIVREAKVVSEPEVPIRFLGLVVTRILQVSFADEPGVIRIVWLFALVRPLAPGRHACGPARP